MVQSLGEMSEVKHIHAKITDAVFLIFDVLDAQLCVRIR